MLTWHMDSLMKTIRWFSFLFCCFINGNCLYLAAEGPVWIDQVFTAELIATMVASIAIMVVLDPTKRRRDHDDQ